MPKAIYEPTGSIYAKLQFFASCTRLYRILSRVLSVLLLEVGGLVLLSVVLMHIECIVLCDLNDTSTDVGAMVGHTLEVGEDIREDKAVLDCALTLLESDDVIELDLIAQIVNHLLERLDLCRSLKIVVDKCDVREVEDLLYRTAKYGDLLGSIVGEGYLLISELLTGLNNVYCVVGDTLIVTDYVEELGNLLRVTGVGGVRGNLDKVGADSILEAVHLTLYVTDGVSELLVEVIKEGYGIVERLGRELRHSSNYLSSSCNRNAGGLKQTSNFALAV